MTDIVLVLLALLLFYWLFGPFSSSSTDPDLFDDLQKWRDSPDGLRERARYSAQRLLDGRGARREQRKDWQIIQRAMAAGWEFEDLYLTLDQYSLLRERVVGRK